MLARGFLLGVLLAAGPALAAPGVSRLVEYTSALDNSTQVYGIYLPASPAPSAAGYPAVFHMHGYGWAVGEGFSDYQRRWADDRGWVLINLNARGPQFYEGVGDVETRNVVRDAHQRFGLDLDRIYAIGGSMGGTGAFRHGVRYPDIFAAVVGVDGWSDYREWHYHWYARTDMRDQIEEFRRPLLEACSPLYWAGRARWGQVQASVSGRDNVVLPSNGLDLYNTLLASARTQPGAYDTRLFLDYEAGHGGSYRVDQAYAYFADRSRVSAPPSFRIESTILTHGALYWGRLDRLTVPGMRGALESEGRGDTLTATTENLDACSLFLGASPVADKPAVNVFVDGFPCYTGTPTDLHLVAERGPGGQLWGWRRADETGRGKSWAMEGPLGEAFKVPFVVVYGTAGSPDQTARYRREAEDFARGWNGFMVHADAVTALPEERLAPADLRAKSLVIYGTENSSRLLQAANARRELPVHVRDSGVVVVDPENGDREYLGPQYGAFLCYPNPLTEGATYLVVCSGQWATKPDGSGRQGLEYDLEKLPWGYGDYTVFNTDLSQVPHVLNVNNKPPVTCYEAGYFVEAGYFDQDWRPHRSVTLDRVVAANLGTARLHVADVALSGPDQPPAAEALIVNQQGAPVAQARVTVRVAAQPPLVRSAVSDAAGRAVVPLTPEQRRTAAWAKVVNVEATAAVYDWRADEAADSLTRGLSLTVQATENDESGVVRLTASVADRRNPAGVFQVQAVTPVGQALPATAPVAAGGDMVGKASFQWQVGDLTPGEYSVAVTARRGDVVLTRSFPVRVVSWPQSPLRILEVKAADLVYGAPWTVTAKIANTGAAPASAEIACSLIGLRCYPPAQPVKLEPGADTTVTWQQGPGEPYVPRGLYPVRLLVPSQPGVTATTDLAVR